MCAQTRPWFILSFERVGGGGGGRGGNGIRTHVTPKKKSPLPEKKKILPRRGSTPRRCIKQDSEPLCIVVATPQVSETTWLIKTGVDSRQTGPGGAGGADLPVSARAIVVVVVVWLCALQHSRLTVPPINAVPATSQDVACLGTSGEIGC